MNRRLFSTLIGLALVVGGGAVAADTPATVVDVAVASPDHTTLVAALKAADYVVSLQNAGPFTVFAPTNAAFAALPPGTLDELTKPEKKADLQNVLKYHVTVSTYEKGWLKDGQTMGMANGAKVTFHVKGTDLFINDAKVLGSVRTGNGIVHVIDKVLLPPAK